RAVEVLKKNSDYEVFAFSGFESPSDASFSSLFLHHGSSFFDADDGLLTTMASDECVDMAGIVSPDNDEVFVQCLKEVLEPRDKQERIRDVLRSIHSIQHFYSQKKARFLSMEVLHSAFPLSDLDEVVAEGLEKELMVDDGAIQILVGLRGNRGRVIDMIPSISKESTNPVLVIALPKKMIQEFPELEIHMKENLDHPVDGELLYHTLQDLLHYPSVTMRPSLLRRL
ncbi:hypothetical protein WA577_007372, partial [Blastocystis sp. JDR]